MSLRMKVLTAAAGAVLALPATASAEPTVDAAKAIYQDLGLTQLLNMPSGRVVEPTATAATNFGYRTYEEVNAELQALADANPGFVKIKTAAAQERPGPRRQVPGDHQQRRLRRVPGQARVLQHGPDPRQRVGGLRAVGRVHLRRHQPVQEQPEGQGALRQGQVHRDAGRQPGRPGALPPPERQRRRHEPQLSVRLGLEHRRHVRPARLRPGLRARGPEHDGHRA